MPPEVFSRVCKSRLLKELQEAIPMMNVAQTHLSRLPGGKVTIVDLCSGFGYLSMLLADTLPHNRVDAIFLVDRSWPLSAAPKKDHHISAQHLQPEIGWRIPLQTVRCNINKPKERLKIQHICSRAPGPVLLLGIHLCGPLSIRAVSFFNANPQITLLALKPCCLPQKQKPKKSASHDLRGNEYGVGEGTWGGGGQREREKERESECVGEAGGERECGWVEKESESESESESSRQRERERERERGMEIGVGRCCVNGYPFDCEAVAVRGRFKGGRCGGGRTQCSYYFFFLNMSSSYNIFVLKKYVLLLQYICPHTTIYVSSYCCMCPHTTMYVSSYY
jgi:hypothetical protein